MTADIARGRTKTLQRPQVIIVFCANRNNEWTVISKHLLTNGRLVTTATAAAASAQTVERAVWLLVFHLHGDDSVSFGQKKIIQLERHIQEI